MENTHVTPVTPQHQSPAGYPPPAPHREAGGSRQIFVGQPIGQLDLGSPHDVNEGYEPNIPNQPKKH